MPKVKGTQGIITDLTNHSIVDILPKRDTRALIQYFKAISKEAREQVKYIVMDMSPLFRLVMQSSLKLLMPLYYHIPMGLQKSVIITLEH